MIFEFLALDPLVSPIDNPHLVEQSQRSPLFRTSAFFVLSLRRPSRPTRTSTNPFLLLTLLMLSFFPPRVHRLSLFPPFPGLNSAFGFLIRLLRLTAEGHSTPRDPLRPPKVFLMPSPLSPPRLVPVHIPSALQSLGYEIRVFFHFSDPDAFLRLIVWVSLVFSTNLHLPRLFIRSFLSSSRIHHFALRGSSVPVVFSARFSFGC